MDFIRTVMVIQVLEVAGVFSPRLFLKPILAFCWKSIGKGRLLITGQSSRGVDITAAGDAAFTMKTEVRH